MDVISIFFLVVFAIVAVLIIISVLLQDEQGEGFGGLFGGGGSATPFGASSGNILVRITTILGVLFMLTSLVVALTYKTGGRDNVIAESRQAAETVQNWFLEQPDDESP